MVGKRFSGWAAVFAIAAVCIACGQSDPGITTAVKSKLAADDTVKAYRIDVDTRDRVVTLTGAVDTSAARERAVEIAKATEGVQNVVDQLTVTPGVTPTTGIDDPLQQKAGDAAAKADEKTDAAQKKAGDAADRTGEVVADAAITSAVKTKFLADPDVAGLKIDVDTRDGVVTLTGTVKSEAEKKNALALAKNTTGVKSVVDRMKVAR
jgi:osmotically-inducible protein OsmY